MINTNYEPLTELINYLELKEKILKPKPMKTAMQELIEIYKYYHSFEEFNEWFMDMGKKAMLKKEKEQIIDAYNHNMTGFDKLEQEEIGLNWAEDYYNQTYTNE